MSREPVTLETVWRVAREQGLASLHDNRLPSCRDWRRPWLDLRRQRPLGGLAALFLDEAAAPAALGPEPSPLDGPEAEPAAWTGVFTGDGDSLDMTPLYRVDRPYPFPWLDPPPAVGAFLTALGYRVSFGPRLALRDKAIVAPYGLDRWNAAAVAVRLACCDQWAARGGAGQVGAELTFALLACELRLHAGGLECAPELKAEWRAAAPAALAEDALHALSTAGRLLREGLGLAAEQRFIEAMQPEEPEPSPDPNALVPAAADADAMTALFA